VDILYFCCTLWVSVFSSNLPRRSEFTRFIELHTLILPPPQPPPPGPTTTYDVSGVCTMTVRIAVPIFPAVSVYWYVSGYVPEIPVFTDPIVAVLINPLPSTLSVHIAH
jgi:hypothetical protein